MIFQRRQKAVLKSKKLNESIFFSKLLKLLKLVAGQLGLKSSRPLSQVGPGSTRPESTRPGVSSERSVTYMYVYMIQVWVLHNLSD